MTRKKLFTLFIYVSFALMGLTGCNDEAFDIDSVNKQTLLIMYPWSGTENSAGLYSDMVNNLNQIENAIKKNKGLKSTRVFVFMSTSATESSLFELTYNSSTFTVEHQILENYTGTAYTTTEGLTDIIGEVKQQAEALNYALIIGGHGTGWNNISDWTDYPNQAKRKAALKTRSFGGLDNTYAINVSSLAQAIETNGIKMQYILFDDCYMANVETAYELRNVTNFLIGSTSEVMGVGMPYQTMWSSLASATPNYTTAANDFYKFYSNYSYPYGGLSVVDCRKMDNLASCMKAINDHFTFDETQRDSLQALDGFNTHLFYDLGDYVAHLCQNTDLLNDFNSALSSAIKATVHTDQLYSYIYLSGPRLITVKHYSGLTISDPSVNNVAVKGKEKTAWWTATH